jgi:hypothetical protein
MKNQWKNPPSAMSESQMKILVKILAGDSLVAAVFGYSQMGSIGAFIYLYECVALVAFSKHTYIIHVHIMYVCATCIL